MSDHVDREMQTAVEDVLHRHGHDVTKFVLIAEVRDPRSGAVPPALYIGTSNETPMWDSMGLLAYVTSRDYAEIAAHCYRTHNLTVPESDISGEPKTTS